MSRRSRDRIERAACQTRELYAAILRSPHHSRLIQAVDQAAPEVTGRLPDIVLVPGILYRDYPHTGADGEAVRVLAESSGAGFSVVQSDGREGLARGAGLLLACLRSRDASAPCIVVSLSKGSAEVRVALEHPDAARAFCAVRAWVSVSGLPRGTASLEYVLGHPLYGTVLRAVCWGKGWDLASFRDLLRHRPRAGLRVPAHLRVAHVVAFPEYRHLRDRRSRRLYRALAAAGPNDGFALLSEFLELPGYVYPLWGADHYLHQVPDMSERLGRLLAVLAGDGLAQRPGAGGLAH